MVKMGRVKKENGVLLSIGLARSNDSFQGGTRVLVSCFLFRYL